MKKCNKCGIDKEIDEFYRNQYTCKDCCREYAKKWNIENFERIKETKKKYKSDHPEKVLEYWKKSRLKNPEKRKIRQKIYCKENRKKLNEYAVNRRKSNSILKISHNIRGRIRDFLKSNNMKKTNKTFEIVGCSPQELKEHLEKQFTDGMNWDNYGYYGWHMDHRIPLDCGKTKEEIYKLCHYTNLQPLWWNENLKKTNKLY